jgi:hypothetical protein
LFVFFSSPPTTQTVVALAVLVTSEGIKKDRVLLPRKRSFDVTLTDTTRHNVSSDASSAIVSSIPVFYKKNLLETIVSLSWQVTLNVEQTFTTCPAERIYFK